MNHYQHHIGDFNAATRHLTRVERSLYRDLMDMYYDTEQPLPASDFDALARKVLAQSDEEKTALRDVLSEFFILDGGVYRNRRCDAEILIYKGKIDVAVKAGKASALARAKQSLNKRRTTVERPLNDRATNHSPLTTHHKPINTYDSEGFALFWNSYPKKVAKPKAESAWKKQAVSVADRGLILSAIEESKQTESWQKNGGEFIPHPASWLNARRWEDGVSQPTKIEVDA